MKNLKTNTRVKVNVKEMALEKLRKTEGGGPIISKPFDTTLGMILDPPFRSLG